MEQIRARKRCKIRYLTGLKYNFFQQPQDDALTDCDTEHVTENLITTVSKKSKSYLEAAKGNLANNNNNNKTFPTRSTLEQRLVENEGEPTAESPTSETEVVPTA